MGVRARLEWPEQLFGMGHAGTAIAEPDHHQVFSRVAEMRISRRSQFSSACWLLRARFTNTCKRL